MGECVRASFLARVGCGGAWASEMRICFRLGAASTHPYALEQLLDALDTRWEGRAPHHLAAYATDAGGVEIAYACADDAARGGLAASAAADARAAAEELGIDVEEEEEATVPRTTIASRVGARLRRALRRQPGCCAVDFDGRQLLALDLDAAWIARLDEERDLARSAKPAPS